MSNNSEYLRAIAEGTAGDLPTPNSNNGKYLKCLAEGGSLEDLPTPNSVIGRYLYAMCGGGSGDPTVPQTGTWQFKTTHSTGFLIIGKDDDNPDQAQFVRMVNGYGWPVVLNTETARLNVGVTSDSDTAVSLYPDGTTANFPDGTTVKELAKYVHNNNKGEIAQHDDSGHTLWSSDKLTDTVMAGFYETYTAGGGTKSQSELKAAIMDEYKDTDVAQGATRVAAQRSILENTLGLPIYTIGVWGGTPTITIDGINVGTMAQIKQDYNSLSRVNNYEASTILSNYSTNKGSLPYYISRDSSFTADNAEALCEALYSDKGCGEIFCHTIVNNGTAEEWTAFKALLDKVKTYTDANKIQVITRHQLYKLGEFVSNPIKSLTITADKTEYNVGDTITAANFTCKAILNDNTEVTCNDDMILDLSGVNTAAAGSYTVTLYYRGFKVTKSISVVSAGINLPQYITEASDGYYQMVRFADNEDKIYCLYLTEDSGGFKGDTIPYSYGGAWIWQPTSANKPMKIFVTEDGSANWSEAYSGNSVANIKSNNATYFSTYTFGAAQQLTKGDIVHIGG